LSRTLAIILAALLVAAIPFYFLAVKSDSHQDGVNAETPSQNAQTSQTAQGSESTENSQETAPAEVPIEEIPFDEQWKNYMYGTWEWLDEGKELIFEFKENHDFIYYEKAYSENPSESEDTASGVWDVVEADNFLATVRLISNNQEQTEIVFRLEFIDNNNMAARTDDMPDDIFVLFTRVE